MATVRPESPVTIEQFRDDLSTTVTVIAGHAQLIQRRLGEIKELPCDDRRRFEFALTSILGAARQMGTAIAELPRTSREWPGG